MTSDQLEQELSSFIVDSLGLEDIKASEIDVTQPLFGDGLGLDSVDALELGIALKKRYGILIDPKSEETQTHFGSIRALAQLVASKRVAEGQVA